MSHANTTDTPVQDKATDIVDAAEAAVKEEAGESTEGTEATETTEAAEGAEGTEASEKGTEDAEGTEETTEETTDSEELDTDVWGSTGDEVADSVLLTLQNSGVDPETAKALLWDAVESGDASKIDRDTLVEKLGKTNATLVLAGVDNVINKREAAANATRQIVDGAAGSKENWDTVAAWATKNVDESELSVYRDMMSAGTVQAKLAAEALVKAYNSADGNTSLNAQSGTITGDAGQAKSHLTPLSVTEYVTAKEKAIRRGASQAVIKQIEDARALGRKQGI